MSHKTTRDTIIEAADQLFYQQGFGDTSFADIADAVQISRGNFYHHFKSKDDILDAVLAYRLTTTGAMLDKWEMQGKHPAERIRSFIHILITNQAKIALYGCPVGTLCTELTKRDHPARTTAAGLFTLFRTWLREQFALLGRSKDADHLAMHVLARSQGIATLAQAFQDKAFVKYEVQQLCDWLAQAAQPARPSHADR